MKKRRIQITKMVRAKNYLFPAVISVGILAAGFAFAQPEEKPFLYDAMGRRDPFIPLVDKDSPTQLRIVFVPPVLDMPVEIKIKGILWNGREFFAIINGEVRKNGDNMDGIMIKAIEQDRVIVEYMGKEHTVFLKKGIKE